MRRSREEPPDIWPAFSDFLSSFAFLLIAVLFGLMLLTKHSIRDQEALVARWKQAEEREKQAEEREKQLRKDLETYQEKERTARNDHEITELWRKKFTEHFKECKNAHDQKQKLQAELYPFEGIRTDRLVVNVTFQSGEALLTPADEHLLRIVARIIFADPYRNRFASVEVEGHADDQPIQSAAFPSNWELSAARAGAVIRLLHQENQHLQPWTLKATGRSYFRPKEFSERDYERLRERGLLPRYVREQNFGEALRQRNRRIEILLNYRLPTEEERRKFAYVR